MASVLDPIVAHMPYDHVVQFSGQEMLKQDALLGCNQRKLDIGTLTEITFDIGNMLVEWSYFNKPNALVFRREYINGLLRTCHIFKSDGKCASVMHYDYP